MIGYHVCLQKNKIAKYIVTILQETELRIKNEKKEKEEDAKSKIGEEEDDLTPQDRYKKLCDLLSKSKFYSSFLLEKMEREDEESKTLKSKNLSGRKSIVNGGNEQVSYSQLQWH